MQGARRTYAAPLKVKARLLNKETGEIKEQEIFMGDFPLMTDSGTFVINGAERVVVSQLVRSPGVYFGKELRSRRASELLTATLIPNRGAWLEYETDANDVFWVRIDKNRKIPVTVFIRALGLGDDAKIRDFFGEDERIEATIAKDSTKSEEEGLLETYRKLRPGEPPTVESASSHINGLFFDPRRYDLSRFGRYKMNKKLAIGRRIQGFVAARDIVAPLTGELLCAAGEKISAETAMAAEKSGVSLVYLALDDKEIKVISNGTVAANDFLSFDATECGINERVDFSEAAQPCWSEYQRRGRAEGAARRQTVTVSSASTVTVDDILASINYLNGLGHGVGTVRTTSTTWATAGCAAWASCCRTSSASAFPAWSASSASA